MQKNNTMINSKSIGNKILVARKKVNLSQAELAKQVAISPQAVGKWERGESMPDITTLSKLAEIFGVDLNYFSDHFSNEERAIAVNEKHNQQREEITKNNLFKRGAWDMSKGNLIDADFSGLKNLKEKLINSNIKNCKFGNSDLSKLNLEKNSIELCDFSFSNIRDSDIQHSNIMNTNFTNCSFIDAKFSRNNIVKCNFAGVNLTGAEFLGGHFEKNIVANAVWKFTSFKETSISDVVFEGTFEDCHFENCTFYSVKFQNATILNTFFKVNRKIKKVQFINCCLDKITYAFLKSNEANLKGVSILDR